MPRTLEGIGKLRVEHLYCYFMSLVRCNSFRECTSAGWESSFNWWPAEASVEVNSQAQLESMRQWIRFSKAARTSRRGMDNLVSCGHIGLDYHPWIARDCNPMSYGERHHPE